MLIQQPSVFSELVLFSAVVILVRVYELLSFLSLRCIKCLFINYIYSYKHETF